MLRASRISRRDRRRRPSLGTEPLESRRLQAGLTPPATVALPVALEPNDTVDVARDLGRLAGGVAVAGAIGDGRSGAADVDWYRFSLDAPARVSADLGRLLAGSSFRGVLSLYNSNTYDFQDPYTPAGHRLLARVGAGQDGGASLDRVLGPGTYYLAVSGSGNFDFHPLLAGSGLPGSMGGYALRLDAVAAGPAQGSGPVVLASDPAPSAVLDRSPFAIRLDLSGPLDPSTLQEGLSVQLTYSPDATFGDANDRAVALAGINFAAAINEVQLFPSAPLAPGHYRVRLAGRAEQAWMPAVAGPDAVPLGATAGDPGGRDFLMTFRVAAAEGIAPGGPFADDTPASARDLGNLADGRLVRIGGAIGDDPFYDPARLDDQDFPLNPANDVDMYRFRVSGAGQYALVAEVFAGRIGSPLDPGISLFRIDPATGVPVFVAGNSNSQNATPGIDGSAWLLTDSVLHAALTAGDYILAVSSGFNTPSPLEDQAPDGEGMFDPSRSHSGRNGFSTGPYVLGLLVTPTSGAPRLVGASVAEGAILDAPPTHFTVRFSQPMNIPLLAFQAYRQASGGGLPAVTIEAADGTRYFPRFDSYDDGSNAATFLMLDGLPEGSYTLRLSGKAGLAGLGGIALVGDGPDGDAVVHFRVGRDGRGLQADASGGYVIDAQPGTEAGADLGVLFPNELTAGIDLIGRASATPGSGAWSGEYRFRLLQYAAYGFKLYGDIPDGVRFTLLDEQGEPIYLSSDDSGRALFALLDPGVYRLRIDGWEIGEGEGSPAYRVGLRLDGNADNPPPLLAGPAPALAIHFSTSPDPAPPPSGAPIGTTPDPATPNPTTPVMPPSFPLEGPGQDSGSGVALPPPASPVAVPPAVPMLPGVGVGVGVADPPEGAAPLPAWTEQPGHSIDASPGATGTGSSRVESGGGTAMMHQILAISPGGLIALGASPVGGVAIPEQPPADLATLQLNLDGASPASSSWSLAGMIYATSIGTISLHHYIGPTPGEAFGGEAPGEAGVPPSTRPYPAEDGPSIWAAQATTEGWDGPSGEPSDCPVRWTSGQGGPASSSFGKTADPAASEEGSGGTSEEGIETYASACVMMCVRIVLPVALAIAFWRKYRPDRYLRRPGSRAASRGVGVGARWAGAFEAPQTRVWAPEAGRSG